MEGAAVALVILLILFLIIAGSAISALILWGLARGLGKIENATFLNSWGLYWIISIANSFVYLIFWGIAFLIIWGVTDSMHYRTANNVATVIMVAFTLMYFVAAFFIALSITKSFWKCTMRQAFMTHLVPLILYVVLMIVGFLLILVEGAYGYY